MELVYITDPEYPIKPEHIGWKKLKNSSEATDRAAGCIVEFCAKGPKTRVFQKSDFTPSWRGIKHSDLREFCGKDWEKVEAALDDLTASGLVRLTDDLEFWLTHRFLVSLFTQVPNSDLIAMLEKSQFPIRPEHIDADMLLRMKDETGIMMVANRIVLSCRDAGNWISILKTILVETHQIATGGTDHGPFFEKLELFTESDGMVTVTPEFIFKVFLVAPCLQAREEV